MAAKFYLVGGVLTTKISRNSSGQYIIKFFPQKNNTGGLATGIGNVNNTDILAASIFYRCFGSQSSSGPRVPLATWAPVLVIKNITGGQAASNWPLEYRYFFVVSKQEII